MENDWHKIKSIVPPLRSVILTQMSSGSGQCSPQKPMPRQWKLSAHPGVADVH